MSAPELPGRPYVTHPGTATGVGRAYSTDTPLGRLMALRGKVSYQFAAEIGMSSRRLSEVLSGRVRLHPKYVPTVCAALDCSPADLRSD